MDAKLPQSSTVAANRMLNCCVFSPLVIPKVTKHLLSNPVFTCIILAACMEIAVVAGFAAFLGKYLEQQFNLTTTSANQLLGLPPPPRPAPELYRRDKAGVAACFQA